jgi:hypothetical protein
MTWLATAKNEKDVMSGKKPQSDRKPWVRKQAGKDGAAMHRHIDPQAIPTLRYRPGAQQLPQVQRSTSKEALK